MEESIQVTDENDNELGHIGDKVQEKPSESVNLADKTDDIVSPIDKVSAIDESVIHLNDKVKSYYPSDNEFKGGGTVSGSASNASLDDEDAENFKSNDATADSKDDGQDLDSKAAEEGELDSGIYSDTAVSLTDLRTNLEDKDLENADENLHSIQADSSSENAAAATDENIKQEVTLYFETDKVSVKEEVDNAFGDYIANTEGTEPSVTSKKKKATKTKLTLEERLTCPTCGKRFTTQSNRLAHEKMVHRNMRHNLCTVCGIGFYSSATLKKHMNKHTGARPYKCTICGKGFTQPGNTKRHMESHSLVSSYECPICKRVFKEKGNMKRHVETHSDKKPYVCTICSKAFRLSSNRQRHVQMVHSKERNFFCNICNKSFSCAESVKMHMKIHTDERNFLCPTCGKRFIARGSLRRHLSVHENEDEKKFQCGFCEKLFKTARTLTCHMTIHTDNFIHFCHICNKGFAKSSILRNHVQTHSKDRPHVCQVCDKGFSNEHLLRRHFAIHGTNKPYGCELCDKKFLYKWYLKKHMNVHFGQRSHVCAVCEKGFANKISLKNHMSIHTGQKDYHCSLCDKSFREQGSLRRHKNSKVHKRNELKENERLYPAVVVENRE